MLQLLADLPRLRFGQFAATPFTLFTIDFADGSKLQIRPLTDEGDQGALPMSMPTGGRAQRRHHPQLRVVLNRPGERQRKADFPQEPRVGRTEMLRFIERYIPHVHRTGPDEWIDERTGDSLNLMDIVAAYGEALPSQLREEVRQDPVARFLQSLKIHLIDTQRLRTTDRETEEAREARHRVREGPPLSELTVEAYSRALSREFERHLADFAGVSTRKDQTFPQRALGPKVSPGLTDEVVRSKYEKVGALRERLTNAGILEREIDLPWPERDLDATARHILSLYLEDAEEKLRIFEPFLEKLEVLAEMLDQRFLYKNLSFDRNRGFRFVLPGGSEISPAQLSSGEQHELLFAYELLFRVPSGALVLIDEPELSLHISWQQRFLRDLERIRGVTDVALLIATHAPQIIHDRWDLAQELGGVTQRG
ncbi:MAG: AAA family ATPase [Actinobacteria bacterium]|nr:AAA family ATPase [Actinomycetota bacterium]